VAFTLYLKLMKVKDKLKQDQQIQQTLDDFGDNQQGGDPGGQQGGGQQGGGQQGGDPSNQQGGGQGGGQQNSDIDNMSGQEAADAAQDAADKAQQAANNASKNGGDPDKAQKAADKAQEAADATQDAADDGDDKTAREKAKEARNAAQEAENSSKGNNQGKDGKDGTKDPGNKQGKDGKDGTKDPGNKQGKDGKNSNNSSGSGQGKGDIDTGDQIYDSDVRDFVDSIVDKYKNSITGILGKFTEQCRQSVACNKQGIKVQAQRAGTGWDKKLKSKITAYVKEKIFSKQRMFKKSFSRPNRRQGVITFPVADGSPINPGKRKIKELLMVDLAFYIDKSGSMGHNIENVFDAYENIAMAVTKLCKGNAVVKDINYRTFIFDTQIKEIKFGQRSPSGGNTCDFEDLLNYISKNTKDILINCIITDADFGVNASEARKFFDESQGLVVVVTNNPNQTLKNLANETKLKTKYIYIEANSDFSLS
jgi:hypothetical protein